MPAWRLSSRCPQGDGPGGDRWPSQHAGWLCCGHSPFAGLFGLSGAQWPISCPGAGGLFLKQRSPATPCLEAPRQLLVTCRREQPPHCVCHTPALCSPTRAFSSSLKCARLIPAQSQDLTPAVPSPPASLGHPSITATHSCLCSVLWSHLQDPHPAGSPGLS